MQPADFKVTRSATMNAAPAQVFEQVNDFHKWDAWSPWAKIDPKMKTTFSGPASGTDASYSWVGNNDVGEGKMVITASHPNEHIAIDLEFIKPFAAKKCGRIYVQARWRQDKCHLDNDGQEEFYNESVLPRHGHG